MSTSVTLKAHLAQNLTFMCPCWLIEASSGSIAAYAEHTRQFVFNGHTYIPSAVESSRPLQKIGLQPNSAEISGVFDDTITRADVEGGKWKNARITYELVNYLDLTMGSTNIIRGFVGKFQVLSGVAYKFEFLSVSDALQQLIGELTSPIDRNTFPAGLTPEGANAVQRLTSTATGGTFTISFTNPLTSITQVTDNLNWNDSAATIQTALRSLSNMPSLAVTCSGGALNSAPVTLTFSASLADMPVARVSVDNTNATDGTVLPSVITNGSSNWTDTRNVVASPAPTRRTFTVNGSAREDSWFKYGVAKFTSGANSGLEMEIKDSVGNAIELQLPLRGNIVAGDIVKLVAGYDGTRTQNKEKFNDMENFNAEPDLPGLKKILVYPQ